MEKGTTVTSVNYCDMLRNEVTPAVCTKWTGRLSESIASLHENARPLMAHLTINTIQKLNLEVLEQPAHSPDLAPSDFYLFGPLIRNILRGCRFADDDKLKEAVHEWLIINQTTFLSSGIKKLADHQAKRIEKKGHYIGK